MVTPIYASLLGFMLIGLSANVVKNRGKLGVALGDGNCIEIKRRMRAQQNLAEYTPLFLILLGFVEYNNIPHWVIHFFGILFLSGRIMHAYSLLKYEKYDNDTLTTKPIWRICGMMCTFNSIGFLSIIIILQSIL